MQKEHVQLDILTRPGILSTAAQEHGPNDSGLEQNQQGSPLVEARDWANGDNLNVIKVSYPLT